MNEQNGNNPDNSNGHRITFLELAINLTSFAIAAIGKDHYQWWILIVGFFISLILSWLFDAEKYDKAALASVSIFVLIFSGGLFIFLTDWPQWTWLIIWPIVYSVMVLILSRAKAKHTTCGNCKKEYAMEVYNTQFLRSENISITKKEWITDVYGKQHENYYRVPGRREYYIDYRRCKYCGYEDTDNYSLEFEN